MVCLSRPLCIQDGFPKSRVRYVHPKRHTDLGVGAEKCRSPPTCRECDLGGRRGGGSAAVLTLSPSLLP